MLLLHSSNAINASQIWKARSHDFKLMPSEAPPQTDEACILSSHIAEGLARSFDALHKTVKSRLGLPSPF